jgi:hypothetical protein
VLEPNTFLGGIADGFPWTHYIARLYFQYLGMGPLHPKQQLSLALLGPLIFREVLPMAQPIEFAAADTDGLI